MGEVAQLNGQMGELKGRTSPWRGSNSIMINTYNADYVVVSYRERENPKKRWEGGKEEPEMKEASKMWFNECREKKKEKMEMEKIKDDENENAWGKEKRKNGNGKDKR